MAPQLLTATAEHSDLLPIADSIAGTENEWVDAYLGEADVFAGERARDWRDDNLQRLLGVANRWRGSAWRFGIMLFADAWQGFTMRSRLHELEAERHRTLMVTSPTVS